MINYKDNIDVIERMVMNYLFTTDDDYCLMDENNKVVERLKVLSSMNKSFFKNPIFITILEIMKEYVKTYGRIPNPHEIWSIIDIKGYEIDREEFDVLLSYDLRSHNRKLVYKNVKFFILKGNVEQGLRQVLSHVKTSEVNADNMDAMFDYVRSHINNNMQFDLVESNDGLEIMSPESHIQLTKQTRTTGFPFFDKVLGGGWEKKTFIVFEGRPKVGKSLVMANLAVRAAMCGANVGVFTVELGDRKYVKRLGSNLLSIPYTEYTNFIDKDNLSMVKEKISEFMAAQPNAGYFIVKELPTGTASSIDIENYFLKIQEKKKLKFDVIFVDYLNLLRPFRGGTTLYEKIKNIAEELRAIAIRNEWTIVSATQVKVSDFNSDLRLDSAAESSGLVATVDSLFGIMGEPGAETITIKNIANRDEGYMESYKRYIKIKKYFRLKEDSAPDSEYWSDVGDALEKEMEESYRRDGYVSDDLESKASVSLSLPVAPNKDFDKEKPAEKIPEPKREEPIVVEPEPTSDYDEKNDPGVVEEIVPESAETNTESEIKEEFNLKDSFDYDDILKNIT